MGVTREPDTPTRDIRPTVRLVEFAEGPIHELEEQSRTKLSTHPAVASRLWMPRT